MILNFMIAVDIDEGVWATEYGVAADEVPADVTEYFNRGDVKANLNDLKAFGPVGTVQSVEVAT